jgi:hypothetical protein
MPIPEQILIPGSTNSWMFNNRRIGQTQKRSLLPRRCYLTDKRLWFKRCEVVTSMITGPGTPVYETYWCDYKAFLLYELKRTR